MSIAAVVSSECAGALNSDLKPEAQSVDHYGILKTLSVPGKDHIGSCGPQPNAIGTIFSRRRSREKVYRGTLFGSVSREWHTSHALSDVLRVCNGK